MKKEINILNKKAGFEYVFIEEFIAGIVLCGTEIKSIRNSSVSFSDSYCFIKDSEVFIKNLHISEYKFAGIYYQHEPKRDRKLLLTKREIKKLKEKTKENGLTIIPTKLFINERGLAKVVIVLAKGKKLYDKRESAKLKDAKKEIKEFC